MDKKNNMKQAMYEMFGVGSAPEEKAEPLKRETPAPVQEKPAARIVPEPLIEEEPVKKPEMTPVAEIVKKVSAPISYLAPGTVLEGNLRSDGDVEIAGQFKGDITAKGTVVLHSSIQGNVTANSLKLAGCSLTGDVVINDVLIVNQNSAICGNVTAKEVQCGGKISGDLKVVDHVALEGTAQITGNITTGSISVVRGAMIRGGVDIKTDATGKN